MQAPIQQNNSLQIIEPQNRITFSSSDSNPNIDMSNDLSYSRDQNQNSLSFQLQAQRRSIVIVNKEENQGNYNNNSNVNGMVLDNQPPKRKRKEIFDKYKVPAVLNINTEQSRQDSLNISVDNDIMRAFDQIFSMGTPRSSTTNIYIQRNQPIMENVKNVQNSKNFERKVYIQNGTTLIPASSETSRPAISPFNLNTRTPQKKQFNLTNSQSLQNSQFFKPPFQLSAQKSGISAGKPDAINLSQIEYRLSYIEGAAQYSRDSSDFADILQAQIFKDQNSIQISKLKQPQKLTNQPAVNKQKEFNPILVQPVKHTSMPNIMQIKNNKKQQNSSQSQSQSQSQSKQQFSNNINNNNIDLQQSRFSDVYQRIDMTQSTVNQSIMMKNSNFQFQNNNNNTNIFGGGKQYNNIQKNAFSRSNSLRSIPSSLTSQQSTLINALTSQKIIQQAAQDTRVPIFMRKCVRLNSTFPNLYHPAFGINVELQNDKFQKLVLSFSEALSYLQSKLQLIRVISIKHHEIVQNFSKNGITLNKFKTCGWETCMIRMDDKQIVKGKPRQNYLARQWFDGKVEKALANYRKIVQTHKGARINLKQQRGIAKYVQIRKKYWQIQKNMILINQDMYTKQMCLNFPKHYIQFKQILEQKEIIFSAKQVKNKKIQLQLFKRLRARNDQLCISQVGNQVIGKLTSQIKFNSSNY